MTEKQAPDRIWSVIDVPKTLAGALAAICAAVVGSYLGVAGTLAGAAIASVIGSVGTELYGKSLERGAKRLQTLTPTFVRAPAAVGTPPVAAAAAEDAPSHTVPLDGTAEAETDDGEPAEEENSAAPLPTWKRVRWGRVALVAGALFVLAMGALTVTELVTGKSVASTVGNSTKAPNTLDGLFNPGGPASSAPAPSASPSASATSTAPTTAPSTATSTAEPSPAQSAGTAPATVAPVPTTAAPTPTVGQTQTVAP